MLGASFGSAAKGTGLKALEFALSICDTVDMYGFTVDPGYKEWYVGTGKLLELDVIDRFWQMEQIISNNFVQD